MPTRGSISFALVTIAELWTGEEPEAKGWVRRVDKGLGDSECAVYFEKQAKKVKRN